MSTRQHQDSFRLRQLVLPGIVHSTRKDLVLSHFTMTNLKLLKGERVLIKLSSHFFSLFSYLVINICIHMCIWQNICCMTGSFGIAFLKQIQACPHEWLEADLFIDLHFIVYWLVPIKKKKRAKINCRNRVLVRKNIFFFHLWKFMAISKRKLNGENTERKVSLFVLYFTHLKMYEMLWLIMWISNNKKLILFWSSSVFMLFVSVFIYF